MPDVKNPAGRTSYLPGTIISVVCLVSALICMAHNAMKFKTNLAVSTLAIITMAASLSGPVIASTKGGNGRDQDGNSGNVNRDMSGNGGVAKSAAAQIRADADGENRQNPSSDDRGDGDNGGRSINWWSRFLAIMNFGAGRSGNVPPGLQHAPGIMKKIGFQGHATSTPGTLSIYNVSVGAVSSTSARVSWLTNVPTSYVLSYGTNQDLSASTSLSSSAFTFNHSVNLTGLASSTNYYLKIVSNDNRGRTAMSNIISFTTASGTPPIVADTVPPVLSGITASTTANASTTGNEIRILWTTNEPANSLVWYATSSPVSTASSTLTVSSTVFTIGHDVVLPGLVASTTYYYAVSSSDASGNTSTSDEYTFSLR